MKYRAIVLEDDDSLRLLLQNMFEIQGYEILTFPDPGATPLQERERCECAGDEICSDVILADHYMPVQTGLDFLAEQQQKGCKCANMAIMSGGFEQEHLDQAESLGLKLFHKPLSFKDVAEWLREVENVTAPERILSKTIGKRTVAKYQSA